MKSWGKWLKESFRLTLQLSRAEFWALLALLAISTFLNLGVEDYLQGATPEQDTQRWVLQLGLGLWDLIEGILLILILSWGVPKVHKMQAADLLEAPFETPYLGSFLAEYLRMLAQILMWGLLLIIPGFVRYSQLIFVPLVALFSKSYRDETVDALRLSEKIAHGRLMTIYLALGIPMALQTGIEFLPQMVPELHTLVLRSFFEVLSFLISIWTYSLIFLMFEAVLQEISVQGE